MYIEGRILHNILVLHLYKRRVRIYEDRMGRKSTLIRVREDILHGACSAKVASFLTEPINMCIPAAQWTPMIAVVCSRNCRLRFMSICTRENS